MKVTAGCVAGITAFSRDAKGRIVDRDSCRMGDPQTGREKVFAGPIDILDPGSNAKFATHSRLAGPFGVSRTYWILDHDEAYGWFITATPDLKNLSIFTRDPQIALLDRGRLVDRARALGYDGILEYPVQPRR
jgi:apolipoprotein D and lipocalin family protein